MNNESAPLDQGIQLIHIDCYLLEDIPKCGQEMKLEQTQYIPAKMTMPVTIFQYII